MASSVPVSEEILRAAFEKAEQLLEGNENHTLTAKIQMSFVGGFPMRAQ